MNSNLSSPTNGSSSSSSPISQKSKGNPIPLSISTSAPPQSLPRHQTHVPLPASPYRTFSDPLPHASPQSPSFASSASDTSIPSPMHRTMMETPKSAGYVRKNVQFGFGKHGEDGDNRRMDLPKRRASNEAHVNVHTECGRHSDDWLFGGWSMGGVVKKVWGRKD